jgi:hypothetical protein
LGVKSEGTQIIEGEKTLSKRGSIDMNLINQQKEKNELQQSGNIIPDRNINLNNSNNNIGNVT